jgi:hypothetical protein
MEAVACFLLSIGDWAFDFAHMNSPTATLAPLPIRSVVSALLPWLLCGGGFFAFLYSVEAVAAEIGDPPNPENDHWQRLAIIACPVLFNAAVILAAIARRWITTGLLIAIGAGCCFVGWNIVRWDIPNLFK